MSDFKLAPVNALHNKALASDKMVMLLTEGEADSADLDEVLGAIGSQSVVKPTPQDLTDGQKSQARDNIRALGSDSIVPDATALAYGQTHRSSYAAVGRLSAALRYLSDNSLTPDELILMRQGLQLSATAPQTMSALAGVSSGTPAFGTYGLLTDGVDDSIHFDFASPFTAYTFVADVEGYDSGQLNVNVSLFSMGPTVNGISSTGGQSLQLLNGGETPGAIFTRNGSGSAVYSDAQSDNGDGYEFGGYMGDPQTVYMSYDHAASPTVKIGVDGRIVMTDSSGNYQSGGTLARLTLGGWNMNNTTTYGAFYKAQWGSVFLYRRVLSEAEFSKVTIAAHILDPRSVVFITQGDSNTSKRSGTNVGTTALSSDNWPDQLVQQNAAVKQAVRLVNHAHNGTSSSTGPSEFDQRVAPFAPDGTTYQDGIYAQMYGTNDLLFNGLTGAEIYALRKSAMDSARALGFVGVHLTVINALTKGAFTAYDPTQQARRVALNNAVAAGYAAGDFEYFADLRNVTALEEAVGAFFYDGLHCNVDGYKLIAEEVAAAVVLPGLYIPRSTARPTISGTKSDLDCSTGTWANTPTSYAYQWYAVTPGASGTVSAIGGATSATYNASGQTGNRVFCRVTATNSIGSQSRSTNLTATI